MNDLPPDPNRRITDNVDHRLTTVETQVKALTNGMDDIKDSIGTLIQEVKSSSRDAHTERVNLHKRIDNHEDNSKITWPVVSSIIGVVFLVAGGLFAYVNLTTDQTRREAELRKEINDLNTTYMTKQIDTLKGYRSQ